ncbi:MAG: glycoside hydrolase family 30 protein [Candidatus Eremiobacteraeota bacterium]|nr:glycoside hydrolase family 30 protein [Candidatus Eremiobacteraeota bacterium]
MQIRTLFIAALALSLPALGQENARFILTAKGKSGGLSEQTPVRFRALEQPEEASFTVMVDPTQRFQTIVGIGGALTDAAAETFAKLPADKQEEFLTAHYDREKGIGYSLGRTHIHSCDFSSHSYTYTADGDKELKTFSIEPDRKYRLPFIKRVLERNPNLTMFVSPWSPPAWMKSNHDMLKGGKLLPEFRAAWAQYYVRFIEAYEEEGVRIWGLTVQNEPAATQTWESCIFTGEEERDFVRDFLGPALHKAGRKDLKLMVWDHNRGLAYQRGATVLSDPEAARYVWGTAFHWYVGDMFETLSRLHDAFPNKAIFFSEGCNYPFSWNTFEDWKWGENYGHSMINDFNHWATGWTDWNVLLDEEGGPNHVKNFCFAPVHADTRKGTLHYQNSYYYIGHFSKYVRPGAQRLACTSTQADLEATAFENTDGSKVAVMMNRTDKAQNADLWVNGKAAKVPLPPHSIATLLW